MGAKAVGALLLLGAALGWGISRIVRERAQRARAEGFFALLCYMRVQIDCFSMPVGDILASADAAMLAACGADDAPPADFGELLALGGRELPPAVHGVLSAFARELGTTYRAEQLRLLDRHIKALEGLCEGARADAPRREKLLLLLPPALVGILILLLL